MRYTPFLDECQIKFNDDVPDSVVNVIDACLKWIDRDVNWGHYKGRNRNRCPEQPMLLAGQPIGQYHCPVCGMMIIAGLPHLDPSGYEREYGQPWPPGYQEVEDVST